MSEPDANGWRPIETAPRDGTSVIVASRYETRTVVGEARFLMDEDATYTAWWWANQSPGDYYADMIYPNPTHWQPLPAPPEVTHE